MRGAALFACTDKYAGNVPRWRSKTVDLAIAMDASYERSAADALRNLPHNLACSTVVESLAQTLMV